MQIELNHLNFRFWCSVFEMTKIFLLAVVCSAFLITKCSSSEFQKEKHSFHIYFDQSILYYWISEKPATDDEIMQLTEQLFKVADLSIFPNIKINTKEYP